MRQSSVTKEAGAVGRMATIRDVAQVAGVSIATASKALNGQGQLRPETRERVQAAAERMGYRPNDLFHSVLRGRSLTVGLISTDTYGRFTMPLLEGVERALGEAGMSVFLASAADDPERERRHVDALLAKRVDGLIVTASRTDPRPPLDVGSTRLPVVYAYTQVASPDASCLLPDDAQGARLAVEHLLRLGRRRVAHVTGPEDHEAVRLRRGAAWAALAEAGLGMAGAPVLHGEWRERWGREAAAQLLERSPRPDAVFCGNDEIAWGVINALTERGVRVPDDVAVVGFDNWEIPDEAVRPPLTSVDMNLHELGRQAGARLLELISGGKEAGVQRLPTRLVVRRSCGAPSNLPVAGGEEVEPVQL